MLLIFTSSLCSLQCLFPKHPVNGCSQFARRTCTYRSGRCNGWECMSQTFFLNFFFVVFSMGCSASCQQSRVGIICIAVGPWNCCVVLFYHLFCRILIWGICYIHTAGHASMRQIWRGHCRILTWIGRYVMMNVDAKKVAVPMQLCLKVACF